MVQFGVVDYVVLVLVVIVSLGIGIFFGRKKQDSREYTSGKGQLGIVTVGLSLTVSFVSAATIQGFPADIYEYGSEFSVSILSAWGPLLAIFTFIPLYLRLDIKSIYEYIDLRFSSRPLLILSYIFGIFPLMLYSGITALGPAHALKSVSGVPVWINILVIMTICTIYTSIGGIKAVIWTDVFQAFIMLAGLVAVIVVGLLKLDDTTVIEELDRRDRNNFHWSPDPTLRTSVWLNAGAVALFWYNRFSTQPALMRYRSVASERHAKRVVIIGSISFVCISGLSCFAGLVIYAYYSHLGCGPLESGAVTSSNQVQQHGAVTSSNQVITYFVADVLAFPGVPGLFTSAIVAATFSSISSGQNAITAIIWQDVMSSYTKDMQDFKKTTFMKITVVIFGALSCAVAFLADSIGGPLTQLVVGLLSIMEGPMTGLFIVGATFSFVGAASATIGTLLACVLMILLAMGQVILGPVWEKAAPIDDTCDVMNVTANVTELTFANMTISTTESGAIDEPSESLRRLFSISPFLFSFIGTTLSVLIALICSVIPKMRHSDDVPSELLFPFVNAINRKWGVTEHKQTEELLQSRSTSFDVSYKSKSAANRRLTGNKTIL